MLRLESGISKPLAFSCSIHLTSQDKEILKALRIVDFPEPLTPINKFSCFEKSKTELFADLKLFNFNLLIFIFIVWTLFKQAVKTQQ